MRAQIDDLWTFLQCLPGETLFLYSDMVPRPQGANRDDFDEDSVKRVDRRRKDANRFGRRLSVRTGGGFISHPGIGIDTPYLFRSDGLHLSEEGCQVFMRDIVSAIVAWGGL